MAECQDGPAGMELFRSICAEAGESPEMMEEMMYETFGMSAMEIMVCLAGGGSLPGSGGRFSGKNDRS